MSPLPSNPFFELTSPLTRARALVRFSSSPASATAARSQSFDRLPSDPDFEQSFGQIAHDSIGAFYPATNRSSTRPEEVWNKRTGRSVWMDERRRKMRPAPLVSLETVH
jgi:hypothetical protein